ncbi:GDSL-type esterase/lipase family protein [candidate division KSB1 bacterium]|nr:GDSL-type esterase/lipase family protein [candidate division KSB1 bacterium]
MRVYLGDLDFYAMHDPHIAVTNQLPPKLIRGVREQFRYSINRQGMRGDDYPENSSPYRILTMGGSTTICSFLDDAKAWPALVQKKLLRTTSGRTVWVGNIGKSGLTTRGHVLQMRYLTPQYPADAILVLTGINDLVRRIWDDEAYDPHFLERAENANLLMFKTFSILPDSLYPFYKCFGFWKLARRTKSYLKNYISEESLFAEIARSRDLLRYGRAIDTLPNLKNALEEYAGNLVQIMQAARQQNFRLIMMTQPVWWNSGLTAAERASLLPLGSIGYSAPSIKYDYYSVEIMAECMRMYNDKLVDTCRQFGVECIDLASCVPQTTQVFYDDCHFTEFGAELVADIVVDYLSEKPPFRSESFELSGR